MFALGARLPRSRADLRPGRTIPDGRNPDVRLARASWCSSAFSPGSRLGFSTAGGSGRSVVAPAPDDRGPMSGIAGPVHAQACARRPPMGRRQLPGLRRRAGAPASRARRPKSSRASAWPGCSSSCTSWSTSRDRPRRQLRRGSRGTAAAGARAGARRAGLAPRRRRLAARGLPPRRLVRRRDRGDRGEPAVAARDSRHAPGPVPAGRRHDAVLDGRREPASRLGPAAPSTS